MQLSELLESSHLEVRLSAGEAIALIYELGREFSTDFQEDFTPELVETLRGLATDSHKYRAKKDRKQQRASFRDILRFIEVFRRIASIVVARFFTRRSFSGGFIRGYPSTFRTGSAAAGQLVQEETVRCDVPDVGVGA